MHLVLPYQICHIVSCYVASFIHHVRFSKSASKWRVLRGYLTTSANVSCYQTRHWQQFCLSASDCTSRLGARQDLYNECKLQVSKIEEINYWLVEICQALRTAFEWKDADFYARQRSYSAYMPWQFRLSVCLSVCLSHGWISQKRLKLGSRNFHHTVAPSL